MNDISVTILTKNSQKYISQVLDALQQFSEVLIYDTGSSDETLAIASKYPNVSIHHGKLDGFGPTHNIATSLAKSDWILSIDSDEIVTPAMAKEIEALTLNPLAVYSFPRDNYYNGKHIRWCGWYPDRQIRLYNRQKTKFTDAQVHEAIIAEGMDHIKLTEPFIHYSYDTVSDFLSKMQSYSDLFAKQNAGKKSSSVGKAVLHGLFAFFKSYFLKNGFLGGREGFEISVYNGNTAFYKYLKLLEWNEEESKNAKKR